MNQEPDLQKPPGEGTPPRLAPDPDAKKKRRDFWLGVGLFFGLNLALAGLGALFFGVLYSLDIPYDLINVLSLIANLLPYVLNIGLIIFLAFKRPQMALGMLAGFGFSIAIVICLGLLFMAACFIILGSSGPGG
ncbi:MAG: hypothetical protein ACOYZ8_18975 [Chloroflexota bacterium]